MFQSEQALPHPGWKNKGERLQEIKSVDYIFVFSYDLIKLIGYGS
jgi:hypothetical protein